MSKKVSVFGKGIPVFVIVILGLALVSAALIPYWGTITGLVTVDQGFKVGGQNWDGDQVKWDGEITSLENGTIHSVDYSLDNNAGVDANIKFATICDEQGDSDGCEDITTTEMVEMSVTGFTDPADAFDWDYYKKSYYETPVTNLSALKEVTYLFEITGRTGFGDTLAPYVVLVSDDFPLGAAVQIIPDGETYDLDTEYSKTIDDDTRFHVPGDTNCAGQDYTTGCTLAQVKGFYPNAELSVMSVALGAWSGASNSITALAGISKVNGEQAVHKSFKVGAGEKSNLNIAVYFPKMMKPDVYDFTTTVEPA